MEIVPRGYDALFVFVLRFKLRVDVVFVGFKALRR